jgi:hypothetical protein
MCVGVLWHCNTIATCVGLTLPSGLQLNRCAFLGAGILPLVPDPDGGSLGKSAELERIAAASSTGGYTHVRKRDVMQALQAASRQWLAASSP